MLIGDDALISCGDDSTVSISRTSRREGTSYKIKSTADVPVLYIDHTADSSRGGFTITSDEHRVKDVTGFSRFELTLASEEERELVVEEEASYETEVASPAQIE